MGLWAIFLTSLFMSLMFPTIFALGLKGLGPNTKIGGSQLVMAVVGGAVLTPIMGSLSEQFHSIAAAYSVPLIALYGDCPLLVLLAPASGDCRRPEMSPRGSVKSGRKVTRRERRTCMRPSRSPVKYLRPSLFTPRKSNPKRVGILAGIAIRKLNMQAVRLGLERKFPAGAQQFD